jgi:hypothetical protein
MWIRGRQVRIRSAERLILISPDSLPLIQPGHLPTLHPTCLAIKMNTRQIIDDSKGPGSLSASFNSDNTCFSVGLDTGFCGRLSYDLYIWDLNPNTEAMKSIEPTHASSRCLEVCTSLQRCSPTATERIDTDRGAIQISAPG